VRRTAIGAGAPPKVVEESLSVIVPKLMRRFSSKEGYELYDDALPALHQLRYMGVGTGVTSGGDNRIRAVLKDLGILGLLNPCVISEEVGVDKSDLRIWTEFMQRTQGIKFREVLHVGDELDMCELMIIISLAGIMIQNVVNLVLGIIMARYERGSTRCYCVGRGIWGRRNGGRMVRNWREWRW